MKKDQLIALLQELPEDAEVVVTDIGCGCCTIGHGSPEIIPLNNDKSNNIYQLVY